MEILCKHPSGAKRFPLLLIEMKAPNGDVFQLKLTWIGIKTFSTTSMQFSARATKRNTSRVTKEIKNFTISAPHSHVVHVRIDVERHFDEIKFSFSRGRFP